MKKSDLYDLDLTDFVRNPAWKCVENHSKILMFQTHLFKEL